ncbi:FIG027190: Putative transmembrane protein, partial [hydrothermal vent metagenome]
MDYQNIIDFWFNEKTKPLWFNSTSDFDGLLEEKYLSVYTDAKNLKLKDWQTQPLGALALVIILDQFPLNMFRGQSQSFETEALSREIAEQAINQGFDAELTTEQKAFLYMPYMHSENLADQEQSLILFNQEGLEDN